MEKSFEATLPHLYYSPDFTAPVECEVTSTIKEDVHPLTVWAMMKDMNVAIVAAEPLFRDGLVAILQGQADIAVVAVGESLREVIRRAALGAGDTAVVSARNVQNCDFDYLVGAQEFGAFRTILIVEEEMELPSAVQQLRAPEVTGGKLVEAILTARGPKSLTRPGVRTVSIERERAVGKQPTRPRGRPRETTGNLPLSRREFEAAKLIASGHTSHQVAEIMGIKEQSAKNLVALISRKLGCRKDDFAGRLQLASEHSL